MVPKLLIADDEPDILNLLSEMFREAGFEVCGAANPSEFERQIMLKTPDLIILDIVFGDQSGPDLYDRAMKMIPTPKVPVIFLSGLVDSRSQTPLVKGRQIAMYSKPFDMGRLIGDIRTVFSISIPSSIPKIA